MALTRDPKLVICDEPTTALDVTVQKQVIKLLNDLQAKLGFAMIFVSHDLALVAEVAHNITVMYAGRLSSRRPLRSYSPTRFTSTPAAFWVPSFPSRAVRAACTRCPAPFRARAISPRAIASRPVRAIRALASDTRPVFKRVPGTEHFYSELPRRGAQGKWFDPSRGGDVDERDRSQRRRADHLP